ncbi:LLM class flavin-dependent oxidoreductase [Amycolatopsis thermoflava]|uniref:LLM class flavin-dependent oxidoreductase n=1 Tax=Amycolatopsis thermoflava TaxID=84480 RepID=UPI00380BF3AC
MSAPAWGYDSVSTADLGAAAAITDRMRLGTCIAQVTSRSAAAMTMAFQTLHAMSGGRVIAGLGSGNAHLTAALEPTPGLPVLLGAARPKMITQTAEIADGWFPAGFAPGTLPLLEEGCRRAGNGKDMRTSKIWAHVDAIVDEDVRRAMRPFEEFVVAYAPLSRRPMTWRSPRGPAPGRPASSSGTAPARRTLGGATRGLPRHHGRHRRPGRTPAI